MFYRLFVIKNLNSVLKIQNGVNMVHSTDMSYINIEGYHSSQEERKDILIIEKDRSTFKLLQLYFKKKGYSSIVAKNVRDGAILTQKMKPKLVLCEISPRGEGQYGDISELEGHIELKNTLFNYMSTLPRNVLAQYIKIKPPENFISKPFDFSCLDSILNSIKTS